MEHHLSIEESIKFGWAKTRQHSTIIFKVILTLFAIQIAESVVQRVLAHTLEGALADVVLLVLSTVLGIGFTLITLRLAEGKHAAYGDIMPPVSVWLPYIGATILAAIVMIVPLILALVVSLVAMTLLPTVAATVVVSIAAGAGAVAAGYFVLRYAVVRFAILDDSDIGKSLRTSAHVTEGRKWWLLGFLVTVVLLNILGAVLLLVGLLVTIPVSMFAYAHVYLKLRGHQA